MKYHLIGGSPFTCYNGTETFSGLNVVVAGVSLDEAKQAYVDNYDNCGGLLLVVGEDGSTQS